MNEERTRIINILNELKGPINDYGFLFNCLIKHKWLYDDHNINIDNIELIQGYKINENFELESYKHTINYDDNFITFDIFNNI